MVEADRFKPFSLFMNIQLIAPNVVIEIPKLVPFFQVQPVQRNSYGELGHRSLDIEGLESGDDGVAPMSDADWAGFRNTIRIEASDDGAESGRYTAATRKRNKHEE